VRHAPNAIRLLPPFAIEWAVVTEGLASRMPSLEASISRAGWIAVALHWMIALAITNLIVMGYIMTRREIDQ
jgi:hypothetical protein